MAILYMTVGVPGSGKSTAVEVFKKEQPNIEIVSSDAMRAELFGDESIQKHTPYLFKKVYERIIGFLKEDKDVVFDACSISKKDRKFMFDELEKNGLTDKVDVIACVFEVPIETCIYRQNLRARRVPIKVIERMNKKYERPEIEEGFYGVAFFAEKEKENE